MTHLLIQWYYEPTARNPSQSVDLGRSFQLPPIFVPFPPRGLQIKGQVLHIEPQLAQGVLDQGQDPPPSPVAVDDPTEKRLDGLAKFGWARHGEPRPNRGLRGEFRWRWRRDGPVRSWAAPSVMRTSGQKSTRHAKFARRPQQTPVNSLIIKVLRQSMSFGLSNCVEKPPRLIWMPFANPDTSSTYVDVGSRPAVWRFCDAAES